jgi:hypothetical protein
MKNTCCFAVPQGEGEHAAEVVHAIHAPLLPGVDDGLRVGAGLEGMAQGGEFRDEVHEVVDLAVEHHGHRAVLVEHGLLAGGDVDDGQAAMAEAQARFQVQARLVGAAMPLHVVDAAQHVPVDGALVTQVENSGDAAHARLPRGSRCYFGRNA